MGKYARARSALNPDIAAVVRPSSGVYYWNGATTTKPGSTDYRDYAYAWTSDITNLIIDGDRAVTFQNTYREDVSGNNSAASSCFPLNITKQLKGYPIAQTVPGSRTFSFLNAADAAAANLQPGWTVCLGSEDGQYLGYPPNTQNTQYVTVKSVSGLVVTTYEPIEHQHRTDYPDFTETGVAFACGAARVWVQPQRAWDGVLELRGIQTNRTPGLVGSQPYATLNKRTVITRDYRGCGFSETQGRDFTHYDPWLFTNGEVDKMMGVINYNNLQGPVGISLQSASPNRLIINGGEFGGVAGCGRQLLVRGAKMDQFAIIDQFGASSYARLEGCDVLVCPPASTGNPVDGAILVALDGVNAQFVPPGSFVLNCSALGAADNINKWAVFQGMHVNLQATTPLGLMFSNDLGAGYVVGHTWDGANTITIQTTLNFPNGLPSWASGSVYLMKVNEVVALGCTGNDIIRNMSDAGMRGERYFEYRRVPFMGLNGQSMSVNNPPGTVLTEVTVDVKQPHVTLTAVLTMIINTVQSPAMILDTGGINVRVQLGVLGKRTWTPAGNTGVNPSGATLDQITVGGGAPLSALPPSRVVGPTTGLQFFTQAPTAAGQPVGEIIMRFSAGIARRPITRQFDDSGQVTAAHTIFPAQGLVL